MVTNIFLLINFHSISKQNHVFEKKRFHFKRDFSFLDIFKMSFFEKSPPDLKTTFFSEISLYRKYLLIIFINYFYFLKFPIFVFVFHTYFLTYLIQQY
jgi:hypothetical protein